MISSAFTFAFKSRLISSYTLPRTLPYCLFFLALSGASPTLAETFVVDGNKALNTNNNFVKVDGNPRMSIWDFNANDADQQFDRLQGVSGSTLLRHRSTGKCLNAYYVVNGGVVTTWPCNINDPAQNFNIISVGNGYSLIQRRGSNHCVDSPSRNNGGMVQLWDCNQGLANQRWKNSSPPQPQPPVIERNSRMKVNAFVAQWNGKTGIQRYDIQASWAKGQCVTLIARYLQDYYGVSRTSLAIDNGGRTAGSVGRQFPNSFLPLSDPSDPIPGAIISFPSLGGGYGHVALVVSSQRSGSNLNIQIVDSNGDNAGVNSVVRLRNLTVDTRNPNNFTASGYGTSIQWVNPKD